MLAISYKKKKCFKQKDVRHLTVPTVPELGLKNIWEEALQIPEFSSYIPDEWTLANKKADRSFFWGILSTLKPDYVEQLLANCRKLRSEQRKPPKVVTLKDMPQDMIDLLLSEPYVSSKSPRTTSYRSLF